MSCCAPGTEGAIAADVGLPPAEEIWLSSRPLGEGRRQSDFSVPEVHCGACITAVEGALRKLPEVERARVNLSTKRVSVVWKEETGGVKADPSRLIGAILGVGYRPHLFQDLEAGADAERRDHLRALAVAGFAATNIMLLSVSVWSGAEASTRDLFHWISAMICAPALVYSGRFYYRSAWNALRRGRTNMDVPIALAITLSYLMSLWETIHHGDHAWFDATASLLFFLLIGRTLDHLMRDRARSAVIGLARLSPKGAMAIGADGKPEYRPVADIRRGDRLSVAAGERLAVDAVVLSGESDIDWSIVNGESAPQPTRAGDKLLAGTMNLTGALTVEAAAEAKESFLAEIVSLMEAAEGGKARYRRLADRAAQLYSPVVHCTAFLSFLGWGLIGGDWHQALLVAISVLIITCPCALGLAVPVVQVIAAGRLFREGVMVKDGSAMERLAEATHALFDKTGTLTLGKPRLVNAADIAPKALAMAAGLAAHSRHPVSRAILAAAPVAMAVETITEIPGGGLEARRADGVWRLGARAFALGASSVVDPNLPYTESVLSLDGRELAAFHFEDAVRPGAAETIRRLHRRRIPSAIISGDREPVAAALAERLGVPAWRSGLTPEGKVRAVEEASARGFKVLMVGDGINDAPALRSAHVSIAPSTAADIGRQAADFVFMRESLDAVCLAIDVSRRAGRLIRQNFALAVGYNLIAVPVAIAGLATPLVASIAMSTSSIIVVANSLRLNGRRRLVDAAPATKAPIGKAVLTP
ncbi:cation-translocating P-type ATPase [Rhizobium sp. TRM95796]|uniref:cation-translocating P-type ATPase n=1 Tax=Rhizobium sp. TRM95796 TaxID=2979862 RepID=UPI0021E8DB42|nr:cation-translocating P-type ATPase [Rhizobium sp. TRM95796]MCV3764381.1 cation-translocating P-type ATPase [Rhizobium sp. TRM95796]